MTLDLTDEGGAGLTAAVGVDVAGEDDGGGSVMNGATAPGVGGDCGVAGKGRRGAAGAVVATAVVVGGDRGGFGRSSADLAGGDEARDARRGEGEGREAGPRPRAL